MRRVLICLSACALAWAACPASAWPQGQDYTGQELNNKDFTRENLNRAHLDRAKLKWAKFRDATAKNASFIGAELRGANFRGALLEGADFREAKLEGACFSDAKAIKANFSGCEIHLARAEPLDLGHRLNLPFGAEEIIRGGDDPTCGGLTFRDANLQDCIFLGNAAGVDFRGADLRGADLGHAQNVDEAILRGAKYDCETRWPVDPEKVGAVYKESDHPLPPRHALVGKWIIMKGVEGAPDHGTLRVWRDNTFEWDPALSDKTPRFRVGYWTPKGDDRIELEHGEGDRTWTAVKSNFSGKPEIVLTSDKGEKRVGAAD